MSVEPEAKQGRLYQIPGKVYFNYFVENLENSPSDQLSASIENDPYVMGVMLDKNRVAWSSECQIHANLPLAEHVDYEKDALARFQSDRVPDLRVQVHVLDMKTGILIGKFLQPAIPLAANFGIMLVNSFLRSDEYQRASWIYRGPASSYHPNSNF